MRSEDLLDVVGDAVNGMECFHGAKVYPGSTLKPLPP